MNKFGYLILNYNNMDETFKCIESIKKIADQDYKIFLVDNGSQDNSYDLMVDLYSQDEKIYILRSDTNLGFSKGNNLGYQYIRDNYDIDFLIVTNNDVIFPQGDFHHLIQETFAKENFDVLGPDVFVRDKNLHQSPIRLTAPTKDEILDELKMYEYYLQHPQKWVYRRNIQDIKNYLCQKYEVVQKFYSKIKAQKQINYKQIYFNCCLQGACIIFSKNFIKNEEKIFSPEPFLYCEEIFLYLKSIEKCYKTIYNPKIIIWHEDSSTMRKINNNGLSKANFTLKHHVAARRLLLKVIEESD